MSKRPARKRPSTEDEELSQAEAATPASGPTVWQRYDLGVIIFALAIFAGGVLAHRSLTRPPLITFERGRLVFERPAGWLPGVRPAEEQVALADTGAGVGAGFGHSPAPPSSEPPDDFHLIYTSPWNARLRVEVRVSKPPAYKNLSGALAVARMARYGEYYWVRASKMHSISKRDWLRTEFRYAFKADKAGTPEIADAIEYAIVDDEHLYQVVVHGDPGDMGPVDRLLRETLRVQVAQESQR
jgi:hypothetical protein